jgi:hypothetical protein
MAIGLDGPALDRGGHAGSRKRLPTIEGAQATSGTLQNEKLNSRGTSPPKSDFRGRYRDCCQVEFLLFCVALA